MPDLEKELEKAREVIAKFDHLELNINALTIFDLGGGAAGGYAASFDFEETLQPESPNDYWFETADKFPRTARAATATEAVRKAIAKCEAELAAHVKKHYRHTNPFETPVPATALN